MTNLTEWVQCPDCDGEGQIETFSDRADGRGNHWTVDCKGPCETCDGDGEIEVEKDPVEPLLNDHPGFEMVFWWKPIAPPEYADKGPFLDNSRDLANRQQAGGQLAIIPRPDMADRPSYVASDAAIMRRWPRLIGTIAAMNNLYVDEATFLLRNYLRGHVDTVMGFYGKSPKELVEGAVRDRFETWKEGFHPDFMEANMSRTAKWRRERCQEIANIVRSKIGATQDA